MPSVNVPGFGVVNFPDNMSEQDINTAIENDIPAFRQKRDEELRPDLSFGEAAKRAVIRGGKQVSTAFGDIIPAIGASALGFDDYAKRQMEEAAATQEEIQNRFAPEVQSYKEVTGPMSGLKYGVETIGEQIPNLATALIPGGVGAMIGRRAAVGAAEAAGLGTKEAAELVASRQALGQNLGVYLGSYSQNAPEVFQNIYDTSGQLEPAAALLFSSISAGLDSAFPAAIMNKLTKPAKIGLVEKVLEKSGMEPSLLRKITAAVPESIALEGLTEGAQEAISLKAENFINKNAGLFNSEGWNRILESSIRGAIAGGAFGAATAIPERLSERAQAQAQPIPTPEPTPEADIVGIKREPAVQEMRTQDGLPITRAGEVDTARVGETLQVPGRPIEPGLPAGTREDLGAGAPGVTTDVEPIDGREAQQPAALEVLPENQKSEIERAHETARKNAVKILGLSENNTAEDRAKAMGFDITTPLYHGTRSDIETLRTPRDLYQSFYTSLDPKVANEFADRAIKGEFPEGANVIPLLGKPVNNPYSIYDGSPLTEKAKDYYMREFIRQYSRAPEMAENESFKGYVKKAGSEAGYLQGKRDYLDKGKFFDFSGDTEARKQAILMSGYDGVGAGEHRVYMNPNDVRSKFAAFDPAKMESADLLAQKPAETIPTTQETAQTITDTLKKEFGNNILTAQKRGLLNIVDSVDQLPAEIQSSIAPNAVGAYSKGKSYIIANRMTSANARRTLLHEVGEHHGLEGMLGKSMYKQVLRQVNQLNKMDPVVTAAHDHVTNLYPELKPGSESYLREVLARIGETSPENTVWRRVVGAVKNFLIKMGLYNPNKFTTADLQDMILYSLRTSLKGAAPAAEAAGIPAVQMAKVGPTTTVDPQNSSGIMGSVGNTIKSTPIYNSRLAQDVRNVYSTLPDRLRAIGLSFLSLPQQADLFGKELPALNDLLDIINKRAGALGEYRQKVDARVFKGFELLKKYPKPVVDKFNDVAHKLTALRIDPRKGKDEQENWNDQLIAAWNNIDKPLRDLAYEYSNAFGEARETMIKQVELFAGKSIADQLRTRFEQEKISFYLPLRRKGNYRLAYFDKDGERVVVHKETPAELAIAVKEAQKAEGQDISTSLLTRELNYKDTPPLGFVKGIIDLLDQNIDADINDPDSVAAKESLINEVYKTYLDTFPDESLRQQMRTRQGIEGYIKDVVGGYADVGSKLAHQVSNLEYKPLLDKAMAEVKKNEADFRLINPDLKDNVPVTQVVQNLIDQRKFLDNPVADSISSRASWFSYMWHIAGNVSSAVVNLTQVPMVVLPMLGGKYGWNQAYDMLKNAYSRYTKGGLDVNRKFLPDFTFGANLKPGDKYYDLYHSAVSRSAIRRSVGYELTEMRRRTTEEFTGTRAKVETGLGWIFQNSERMNREVTLIAAYDLEMAKLAKEGITGDVAVKKAIDEAIDMTTRTHSHALSEAGPRMFQNGLGKVAFTFKSFAQAQIYNMARLFYLAFKGEKPEIRRLAQKQLTGILGMTYAFSGLQGLPTYGAANMFASAVSAMFGDDDEPFDFDEAVRTAVGDIGYKGPLNALTNIDIASRTGFNGMVWHDDPRRLAEVGFAPYFIEHFFGPSYQALFVNPGRAITLMKEGQVYRGLETVTPSFVRNPLKAFRFATEGATTTNGAPIVDDVSAYSAFMQIFGFTNAELSEAYARAGSMKKAEQKIASRRTSLLDLHFLAKSNGDDDMLAEIKDKIAGYNESYPSNKISPDTLARSYRGHMERIKNSVDGVYLNKKLKNQIIEEYGD
jgi:hypothetical protein